MTREAMSSESTDVGTDAPGENFTMIYEWILDAPISDRAVRLYGVLRRYLGANDSVWPSRGTLSRRLRCSRDSVDRALKELVSIGAVMVSRRHRDDGSMTSSSYTLWPRCRQDTPAATLPHPPTAPARPASRTGQTPGKRATERESDEPFLATILDAYPRKVAMQAAQRALTKQLKNGVPPEHLLEATLNYANRRRGSDPNFTKHGATFFGPDDNWRDYLNGGPGLNDQSSSRALTDAAEFAHRLALQLLNERGVLEAPTGSPILDSLLIDMGSRRIGQMSERDLLKMLIAKTCEIT